MTQPNQSAAASRRPAGQSDGSGSLSAMVAADRAFPTAVAWSLGIMRALLTFLALCLIASLFCGCASSRSSRPRADSPEVIEQVRSRVLQLPTLDTASREMIQTTAPKIWFVGLPFGGDYTFQWLITSNRTVEFHASNGLEHFSDRAVIREPAASGY